MATFTDIFNGSGSRLGQALSNPWTQLGMQMLAASGYQQQPMSFGQRLAQAGQGFMQQQQQAQELAQQRMLREYQMAQLGRLQKRDEREEQARAAVQGMFSQNPDLLAQYPLARTVASVTGDLSQIPEMIKATQPQGGPKAPWQYKTTDAQGFVTEHTFDPATQQWRQGTPYRPTAQQQIDLGMQREQRQGSQWEADYGLRREAQESNVQYRQAQTQAKQQELQTKAAEAHRKSAENALKTGIDRVQFQSNYRGAVANLDDTIARVDALINHPGLNANYGVRGNYLPEVKGADAASARALIEQMKEVAGFSELNRLKAMGVNLAPVTEAERDAASKAAIALDKAQGAGQAREMLQKFREVLLRSKAEAQNVFNQTDALYNQYAPSVQQPQMQAPGAPAVGTIEDGYEFMGGDPANPNSWRKR